jgi:hypothetical protein
MEKFTCPAKANGLALKIFCYELFLRPDMDLKPANQLLKAMDSEFLGKVIYDASQEGWER